MRAEYHFRLSGAEKQVHNPAGSAHALHFPAHGGQPAAFEPLSQKTAQTLLLTGGGVDGKQFFEEALEDNIEDELSYYDFEDDDEEEATRDLIRSRTYKQDTAWDIYQLDKNKLPTLDFNELGDMFYDNPDEFLEKYAIN